MKTRQLYSLNIQAGMNEQREVLNFPAAQRKVKGEPDMLWEGLCLTLTDSTTS